MLITDNNLLDNLKCGYGATVASESSKLAIRVRVPLSALLTKNEVFFIQSKISNRFAGVM